jgi:hypothetical protein
VATPPVPVPRNWTVGEVGTGAYENSLRDGLNFLLNPPAATLVQVTATTTLATGAWTAIGFDSSTFDGYGGHSNSTNNSRYTIQAAGKYLVGGAVAYAANSSGNRAAKVMKNGAVIQGPYTLGPTSPSRAISASSSGFVVPCQVGDYLEIAGFQDTGGNIATTITADQTSFFTIVFVSS